MGTSCSLHLYADDLVAAERAAVAAAREIWRIEYRYSRYRADSDLSAINQVAEVGGSIEVDDETAGLLDYAFAAYQKSDGLFDISSGLLRRAWNFKSQRLADRQSLDELLPRVGLDKVVWENSCLTFSVPGMELDFGGLAKEYAADRVAATVESLGIRHGLVDLGGDIRLFGPHPGGEPWQIGIRHPLCPKELLATVPVSQGAIATSGEYERCITIEGRRYSHLLHPRTGWPVHGLASVTVINDQCLVAGSVCTIAMLKGHAGIDWLSQLGMLHLWSDSEGRQGGELAGQTLSNERRAA
ncbi:MAG TPA: FAD:protein FMN transferase, partial [Planctomycetaceae bacterium]|nr:FAD:protein FMN transferase [Planctomycetaceae bacterium]